MSEQKTVQKATQKIVQIGRKTERMLKTHKLFCLTTNVDKYSIDLWSLSLIFGTQWRRFSFIDCSDGKTRFHCLTKYCKILLITPKMTLFLYFIITFSRKIILFNRMPDIFEGMRNLKEYSVQCIDI